MSTSRTPPPPRPAPAALSIFLHVVLPPSAPALISWLAVCLSCSRYSQLVASAAFLVGPGTELIAGDAVRSVAERSVTEPRRHGGAVDVLHAGW